MTIPWIFVEHLPTSAHAVCRITADEARHAAGSRRLRVGDPIQLFDGRGGVALSQMGALDRDGAFDAVVLSHSVQRARSPAVEIASAIPKGDRLATLFEAIGPLAAARFTPLACTHSVVPWSPQLVGRAQRVLIASCKQAHQPWLPTIASACDPLTAADDAIARSMRVFIAHPDGSALAAVDRSQPSTVLIGPEGGFTDAEVASVEAAGGQRIALGSAILRIELAVAVVLAQWRN
ncbi:MAG: 16S rRNA (uracil(1498)-N(3))-methyltransferase [Phycisphaerales bacterium]|nr:16S rRNA (uracil(1498)-N(3))-methyltransferase [Phycisphaerales bacterium]